MFKYVIKRLLYAIPVFLGITFVIYLLINLAPGGPLAILASSGEMSQADLEAMRITLGLDKPIVVRYFLWLADLFHGDLGVSYRTSQDVAMMISQRISAVPDFDRRGNSGFHHHRGSPGNHIRL